jgi:large subunit ribosomal protein L9
MARNVELLLLETIENLGIVGDIVKVKPGFARNYLLPHAIAEFPTEEKIESLKEARAKAQAHIAKQRAEREALVERMQNVEITLTRSCNDQGVLYGSITQRDISDALAAAGYGVDVRAVRLSQSIRRVGSYHVPIQFEKDLKAEITLTVKADRLLETETREQETAPAGEAGGEAEAAAPEQEEGKPGKAEKSDKPARAGGEKPARKEKSAGAR